MSVIHWVAAVSGGFDTAADWTGGVVPEPRDEAVLDAPGSSGYTVTVSAATTVGGLQTAANATLAIAAGALTDSGASLVNAGTISIADGGTLAMSGMLDNGGILVMQGVSLTGPHPYLRIGSAGLTLSGGGELMLADALAAPYQPCPPKYSLDRITGDGGALINLDNTIVGAGCLGCGRLTLTNSADGVIDASLDTDLVMRTIGTSVNQGLLEATGAGGLYIEYSTVDNHAGGVISANGARVFLSYDTVIGGTFTDSGSGYIYLDHGFDILDGSTAGAVTNEALIACKGATLTIDGVINNIDEIRVGTSTLATDLIIGPGGAALSGGGKVVLNSLDPSIGIVAAARGAVLVNVDNTISGRGEIGARSLHLINEAAGLIEATSASLALTFLTGAIVTNAGLIEASGRAGLTIRGASVDGSGGGTILAADGSRFALQGADLIGGTLQSTGTGVFRTYAGANQLDGTSSPVGNEAVILVSNSTSLSLQGAIVNSNEIQVESGGADTRLLVGAAGATLSGGGQVLLDAKAQNFINGVSAAATLINVDNTISGAGQLGAASLTLINQAVGVIIGSQAAALVIDTGADTIVNAGRIVADGLGGVTIASAIANSGTLEVDTGAMVVNGAASGTGAALIVGGTLDFTSCFSQNVTFGGASGVLELGQSRNYAAQVVNFSKTGGTSLDLSDIAFVSSTEASFSGTANSGVLTVSDGTHVAHISLEGDYLASTFAASSDGHGGTVVIAQTAPAAASAHRFVVAAAGLGGAAGVELASAAIKDPFANAPMLARPAAPGA